MLLATMTAGGCAPKANSPEQKTALQAGYGALESQQYDQAIARADAFLTATPQGPGSAEALYLKGRALEGKTAANEAEAKRNLQAARSAYLAALEQSPSRPLDAYIRTSLANVAYFQDDYPTAISQWSAALDHLDREDVKAWALYRIGLCQQRLGKFADADRTFAQVQNYPGVPAQRAREHQGARGFFVQLATFASAAQADQAIAHLSKQGIAATKATDPAGHHVVRVAAPTYRQAEQLKSRFAGQYPDALIVP
jgi:TolA-binding protein